MSAAVSLPAVPVQVTRPLAVAVVVYRDARGVAHLPDGWMRFTRCRRAALGLLQRTALAAGDHVCPLCRRHDQ